MRKRLLSIPIALLALVAAAPTALAEDSLVSITGVATATDFIAFDMVSPPSAACGVYTECIDTTICFATLNCNAGDTGAVVAAALVAAINAQCGGAGFSAVLLNANTLRVSGPAGVPFECCLFVQNETAFCGPATGNDTIPLSSGGGGCIATNVCDGIPCNENLPQAGGLQFAKAVNVPAMDSWGVASLVGVALLLGVFFIRRAQTTSAFG